MMSALGEYIILYFKGVTHPLCVLHQLLLQVKDLLKKNSVDAKSLGPGDSMGATLQCYYLPVDLARKQ